MNTFKGNRCQGITVIEILVTLAVLAVMLAFAGPRLEDGAARSAFAETTSQGTQAFHLAEMAAQVGNSIVRVTLDPDMNSGPLVPPVRNELQKTDQ